MSLLTSVSLLSEEGLKLLSSEESLFDERLFLVFRKQLNDSTCGIASICIVLAALNFERRNYCQDSSRNCLVSESSLAQEERLENCDTPLTNLRKLLLSYLVSHDESGHKSFLEALKETNLGDCTEIMLGMTNNTEISMLWPQKQLLHKELRHDTLTEKCNRSDNSLKDSFMWFDEIEFLNSEKMSKLLNATDVLTSGATLDLVAQLLRAYGLEVQLIFASEIKLEDFRSDLTNVLGSHGLIIANYDAKVINKKLTFSGHHSPLGAYDPHHDQVLILDVWPSNAEIYVSSADFFIAMNTTDKDSGKSRGYVIVYKKKETTRR